MKYTVPGIYTRHTNHTSTILDTRHTSYKLKKLVIKAV